MLAVVFCMEPQGNPDRLNPFVSVKNPRTKRGVGGFSHVICWEMFYNPVFGVEKEFFFIYNKMLFAHNKYWLKKSYKL